MNMPVLIAIMATFLGLVMLGLALAGPSTGKAKTRRMAAMKDRHAQSTEAVVAAQMRKTIMSARGAGLMNISALMPRREVLQLRLKRTGKPMTVSNYMFVMMGLFVGVGGLLLLLGAPFLLAVLVGAAVGMGLPHMAVSRLIAKRVKKFNDRFPDAIDLLVRGLRSGLPVTETFNVVSHELPGPLGDEFKGICERIRIGKSMDAALQETADNIGTPEFQFFCITNAIQRETGGNLAETLGNLSDVLRKRAQMKLKIRAMSSEAKASAYIVGALPFFVFGIVWMMNPAYLIGFFTEERLMIAGIVGLVWMGIGVAIMAKMISFEI